MCFNEGNILRVVTSDDHVINIEKKKSATTGKIVNKQHRIMSTGRETSSSHYRSVALKPCTMGLLKAVNRATKSTNHSIDINLLMQLTIKKTFLTSS
jgi:hypothetical protein